MYRLIIITFLQIHLHILRLVLKGQLLSMLYLTQGNLGLWTIFHVPHQYSFNQIIKIYLKYFI